ncbi:MAG: hypothetical protein SOV32_04215 [Oscillospiraceae bacterium]|nr:hypothetical protein [Clostridiales bacterium]MDD7248816.1 hypothetical protein [Clostridiales bacterium]MDY2717842.1 hypothetical protein [Oscillospiraceae bacterium]
MEPGTSGQIEPIQPLRKISALSAPVIIITIFLVAMRVPMPIVIAACGTSSSEGKTTIAFAQITVSNSSAAPFPPSPPAFPPA